MPTPGDKFLSDGISPDPTELTPSSDTQPASSRRSIRPLAPSLPDDTPAPAADPRSEGADVLADIPPSPASLRSGEEMGGGQSATPDLIAPSRPSPAPRPKPIAQANFESSHATPRADGERPVVVPNVDGERPIASPRTMGERRTAVPLAEALPEEETNTKATPRPKAGSARLPRADAEDMTKRLTLASIQFRKGQPGLAIAQLEELLELYPNAASAHELLGDIYASAPPVNQPADAASSYSPYDPVKAQQAYEQALALEPGRVTAESKLARLTLRDRESRLKSELGIAYAGADAPVFASAGSAGSRGLTLSLVATALLPGLGQILRGEYLKGGAIVAGYLITVLIWAALPESREVLGSLFRVRNSHPAPVGSGFAGGALLTLSSAIWLYALVDIVWISKKPR